jgi:hypothetical protein
LSALRNNLGGASGRKLRIGGDPSVEKRGRI